MKSFLSLLSIVLLCVIFPTVEIHAQNSLVLNGAVVTISNGAKVVIDNPASNAIITNSGHIVSEGENNQVIWNIGNSIGTYTLPWGDNSGAVFPLTVTTFSGAIQSNGAFHFSTYNTSAANLPLPSMVSHINNNLTGANNSLFTIDRFWIINAVDYTLKPPINLEFDYLTAEHQAPNTIIAANLQAQRFNSSTNVWGDWGPFGLNSGTSVGGSSSINVSPTDFFEAWTLVDNTQPLPIELISFSGECKSNYISINWTTASETNNALFNIYKSTNGIDFSLLHTQNGAINSAQIMEYTFKDYDVITKKNYQYKLEQVDLNGKRKTFDAIEVTACNRHLSTQVYYHNNNITLNNLNTNTNDLIISVVDKLGQVVYYYEWNTNVTSNQLKIDTGISSGVYFVNIFNGRETETHKVLVN